MVSLILEDGSVYHGNVFGACKSTTGEVGKGPGCTPFLPYKRGGGGGGGFSAGLLFVMCMCNSLICFFCCCCCFMKYFRRAWLGIQNLSQILHIRTKSWS